MLSNLSLPFKFATVPVAVLAVIIYVAVFSSVLSLDELPRVPKNLRGLNLERGYEALSKITTSPHPYISHANDDVRRYILDRLQVLANRCDYIHLSDDMTSNVTYFASSGAVVYFEGTNVLLKIDGTDSPLASPESGPDGVLFSCHYDSVSSAPGATDDGMGVATLLEMAEYFAVPERRPRRTAIFFFNNGEEDYLNGAHAWFEHPWSNLTSMFINLEGAASGGRPIVFRSTSMGAARSLLHSAIKHPHGTVLSSEAYATGMIRSGTDYQVYTLGVAGEADGLEGFDFAFYHNRAYYHTLRDTIAGMGQGEARKALWAMMELTRGAGLSLLNDDESGPDSRKAIYFDILGRAMVLFSMDGLYAFNIVMLVIGPLTSAGLIAWVMLSSKGHSGAIGAESDTSDHSKMAKVKLAVKALAGWGRFWIALIVAALVHTGLITGFVHLNPYILHSHAYAALAVFLALSYLAVVLPLQIAHYLLPPTFVSQKLAVLLSLYSFTWLLLLGSTILMSTQQMGSLYWAAIYYLGAWLAVVLELVHAGRRGDPGNEMGSKSDLFNTPEERAARAEGAVAGRRLVRGVLYQAPEQLDGDTEAEAGANGSHAAAEGHEPAETEPTEITPLMHQHRRISQGGGEYVTVDPADDVKVVAKPADEYGWWIAQMLLLVPAPALMLFQIEVLLLNALMHALVDGTPAVMAYRMLALFSVLVFIPLAPFAHKLPQYLNAVVTAVFVVLLVACWTSYPFTQEWPFRVYFQQSVELSPAASLVLNPSLATRGQALDIVRAETTLTGLKGYVDRLITPEIPSSWNSDVSCGSGLRPDLVTCKWATDLLPHPGGNNTAPEGQWLDVRSTRFNATRALFSVRGENTRGCRLYFDKPVTFLYVHQPMDEDDPASPAPYEKMHMQGSYELPPEGAKEVRLWSREWGRTFVVEVGWEAQGDDGSGGEFTGRAACEYAEYASALDGPEGGRIPAYEEVKQFLPLWALPTKLTDGLVEVWTRFAV